jgi:hypothetical protein
VYDGVTGRWDGRVGGQLAKSRSRKEWLIAVSSSSGIAVRTSGSLR